MLDERRTLVGLESVEAGPMPGVIGRAVARRRLARRARVAGAVVGCLVVVGAIVAWSVLPEQSPLEPGLPLVEGGTEGAPGGVRFERGSVLALRMAGIEDGWSADLPTREAGGQGDVTLYGLRERALAASGTPAS